MHTKIRWRGTLGAALLALALGGCAQMEPRLWVPDEVKQQLERVDLPGIGLSRSGDSVVDGRVLHFRRSASTTNWFGVVANGSGQLSVDVEGDPALGVECRSSRSDVKLFGLHLEKPLSTNCEVRQGESGSELRLWTQPMGSPREGEEVRGEWTLPDGQRLFVYSEHRNPAGGTVGRPLGFTIVQKGRALAWVDVSHWQPRLYLPRDETQRRELLPVAVLLALLVQPGSP